MKLNLLFIGVILSGFLVSCGLLGKAVRKDITEPEVYRLFMDNKEFWCTDRDSYEMLLKEAYRDI